MTHLKHPVLWWFLICAALIALQHFFGPAPKAPRCPERIGPEETDQVRGYDV